MLKYVTTSAIGTKFLNAAVFYGLEDKELNLKLIRQFLESNDPELNFQLVLSIKGALKENMMSDGSKESITKSIENILSFIPQNKTGRPTIIFDAARVDPLRNKVKSMGFLFQKLGLSLL